MCVCILRILRILTTTCLLNDTQMSFGQAHSVSINYLFPYILTETWKSAIATRSKGPKSHRFSESSGQKWVRVGTPICYQMYTFLQIDTVIGSVIFTMYDFRGLLLYVVFKLP